MVANPQTENGYFKIANEIWDALCKIRIPGEARQVLDAIIRKTYGWDKEEDKISLSQISEMTGIKRQNVPRAINRLIQMQIVIKNDDSFINSYKINENYELWQSVINTDNNSKCDQKRLQGVIKSDDKGVINSDNHKRQKDNSTKDNENSVEFSLTEFCIEKILRNHGHLKFNKNDKDSFSNMFDKLLRIDGYSVEQIRDIITWVTSQTMESKKGFCWAKQFKSPLKLRRKIDRIKYIDVWISEMNRSTKKVSTTNLENDSGYQEWLKTEKINA